MKYLKPPYLSSPLSKSGKNLKRRLANILSPSLRRGGAAVIACTLILSLFIGCEEKNIGIIGGADGPTAIFVTDNAAKELYKYKTPYVGNASAVGSIAGALIDSDLYKWQGTELQTAIEPYEVTLRFILLDNTQRATVPADPFDISAPLFFALIDNLGLLTIRIDGYFDSVSKTYTREDINSSFEKPVSQYAASEEGFEELYALCFAGKSLDFLIESAVLERNASRYAEGEFSCEAHIILQVENDGGNTVCCLLTQYGEYGFENGVFTTVSGSGLIPARITFDESMTVSEYVTAKDGSYYLPSIKEMFPASVVDRAVSPSESDVSYCRSVMTQKAEKYLASIGRAAKILDYCEFSHTLLTDAGISVDVSNKLVSDKKLSAYPYWLGSLERVEDEVRYVYSLSFDKPNDIIYTKRIYPNGKIVEKFTFDAKTGEQR